MELTIDFEARSPIDIKKCGGWVYARHPLTEVLCLSVKINDDPSMIWVPENFSAKYRGVLRLPTISNLELSHYVNTVDRVSAYNAAGFEIPMWTEHMVKRRGFPAIKLSKWHDTAAQTAMCGLPRALDEAAKALGLDERKDAEGHKLMLAMTSPRPLVSADIKARFPGEPCADIKRTAKAILAALKINRPLGIPDQDRYYNYRENEADMIHLCRYCLQDTEVEYAVGQYLPDPPPASRKAWELDQVINARGIQIDLDMIDHAEDIIAQYTAAETERLREITGDSKLVASKVAQLRDWINGSSPVQVGDLTKATVKEALDSDELSDEARQVLEIRQSLGRSSLAKLPKMRMYAGEDGRARGTMIWHGAGTGRRTGSGPQPHNFPRGSKGINPEGVFDILPTRDLELLQYLWGDPMDAISSSLRGFLVAAPGKVLTASDYSAIEGRGLAWLAGEQHIIDGYIAGLDPYKVAASGVYGIPYEDIDSSQRQVGKVAELAAGYQGGWRAMLAFGADKIGMTEAHMRAAISGWRANRPATVRLWAKLEEAAFTCLNTGKVIKYRTIRFDVWERFLRMRLPSGRFLYYFDPIIKECKTPWGESKAMVTVMTVDSKTKKWVRRPMHGGLWTENATQALCSDILDYGIENCEKAGYRVVLDVHDEIVSETDPNFGSISEMERVMSSVPHWAVGFPITAKGFRSFRYKK